jgi:cold shock CspA family protein
VEWNEARGFGFVTCDGQKVFVHAKAFLVRDRTPAIGDMILFSLDTDNQGRPRAARVEPLYPNARIVGYQFVVWIVLLVPPVLALRQFTVFLNP